MTHDINALEAQMTHLYEARRALTEATACLDQANVARRAAFEEMRGLVALFKAGAYKTEDLILAAASDLKAAKAAYENEQARTTEAANAMTRAAEQIEHEAQALKALLPPIVCPPPTPALEVRGTSSANTQPTPTPDVPLWNNWRLQRPD